MTIRSLVVIMDNSRQNLDSSSQITYGGEESKVTRTKSSSAMPCGMPKWLTRITGQQQNNYTTISTSQAKSLGSSFSDPGLIGVGCTPPRSNHFIVVGSSEGKATARIVEQANIPSNNYDAYGVSQKYIDDSQYASSSSNIMIHKGALGISFSASNSPASRRRGSTVLSGSGKRTWNGSGSNNLNFQEAMSPTADSDYYNLLRQRHRQRSSSNIKENISDNNAIHEEKYIPFGGDHTIPENVKSSRLVQQTEFRDLKDLKGKIAKVLPTGSEFPIATKESLDGLKRGSMKETEDDLFDMDEHPTALEENHYVKTLGVAIRPQHLGETENSGKMTLTQQILENGMPQNWFFMSGEMEGRDKDATRKRDPVNVYGHQPINVGQNSNRNQMRDVNIWAPQNL